MQAITVSDRDAGVAGLSLTDLPYPEATDNDVVVRVHAAGFTRGELDWPHTWIDRAGRDRTPSVPGHELSGVVVELGYGTTLLSVGQRVFGLADWARNGSLAGSSHRRISQNRRCPGSIQFGGGKRGACGCSSRDQHMVVVRQQQGHMPAPRRRKDRR